MKKLLHKIQTYFKNFWQRSGWNKAFVILVAAFLLCLGTMYGIARWYMAQVDDKPLKLGTSFIPAYAESLGLDPQETMDAVLDDLGVKHLRLVSYWDQLEPTPGQYDFSLLDWQFQKAEAAGAKVTLGLGLRQPRWPECHAPQWAQAMTQAEWQPRLMDFIEATVNRYKDSPSLDSYQLENEYFLKGFGMCVDQVGEQAAFDRQRLVDEYNLVKELDPDHTVIVVRSNNALGFPIGEPQPDEYGISIYKRVWDSHYTHRYLEYPFPAWYYGFLAGVQLMFTDRDMIIHELQAEAYGPNHKNLADIDLAEQNKSFNAERFEDRVEYGKATGMREIYLWGSEYWYYRKVKLGDPTVWEVARQTFAEQP